MSPESAAASASAEVTAADLFALFDAGATLPFGVDLDVSRRSDLLVHHRRRGTRQAVWAMVDWSIAGAPAAEYAVYAEARAPTTWQSHQQRRPVCWRRWSPTPR